MSNEEFKSWLVPTDIKSQTRCKRCKKTFDLSNTGVQTLKSHKDGKKERKEVVASFSVFFKKLTKSQSAGSESSQRNVSSSTQQ